MRLLHDHRLQHADPVGVAAGDVVSAGARDGLPSYANAEMQASADDHAPHAWQPLTAHGRAMAMDAEGIRALAHAGTLTLPSEHGGRIWFERADGAPARYPPRTLN